jgi:beta-fructofuranosidase
MHYTDVNEGAAQFISPSGNNGPLAVFDGAVISEGIDGLPTLMYSGVQALPITWSRTQ